MDSEGSQEAIAGLAEFLERQAEEDALDASSVLIRESFNCERESDDDEVDDGPDTPRRYHGQPLVYRRTFRASVRPAPSLPVVLITASKDIKVDTLVIFWPTVRVVEVGEDVASLGLSAFDKKAFDRADNDLVAQFPSKRKISSGIAASRCALAYSARGP